MSKGLRSKKSGIQVLKLFLIFALSVITIHFSLFSLSYAAHPLETDDTGTQGKGKFQIEFTTEFAYDKQDEGGVTTKTSGGEVAAAVSYGLLDNVDLVLGVPYGWGEESGLSDISLEAKWRFYEIDKGWSLALKPGISIPTGGEGKATYGITFITTKELDPWAFHFNLGYTYSDNTAIWNISAAAEVEVAENLKVVGNIGMETNPDKESNVHPAFILGGLIYSISENIAVDVGIKGGLNEPETDLTFLAGIAFVF